MARWLVCLTRGNQFSGATGGHTGKPIWRITRGTNLVSCGGSHGVPMKWLLRGVTRGTNEVALRGITRGNQFDGSHGAPLKWRYGGVTRGTNEVARRGGHTGHRWSEFVNESQCFSLFYCMNPAGKASRLCEQKQSKRTDFCTGQYNNLYIYISGLSFWLAYIYRLLLQLTSQPKRILSRVRLTANTPFWAEPKLVCAIR